MNCIEKMYKEIEEILQKEKNEASHMQVSFKEIKYSFDDKTEKEQEKVVVDYLSSIVFDEKSMQKKYFDNAKALNFIYFIFKKYATLYDVSKEEQSYINDIEHKVSSEEDLVSALTRLENEFVNLSYESDELKEYFTNPYNALFKDEKGYYAVILNGKFSDVKRPQGYIANQIKKVVKDMVDKYVEDFLSSFSSDKERNTFLNNIKAEVNKLSYNDPLELQTFIENYLFNFLSKKNVTKEFFDSYLLDKGLTLEKQGNFYYNKKAYQKYAEYKKIEFRYWLIINRI